MLWLFARTILWRVHILVLVRCAVCVYAQKVYQETPASCFKWQAALVGAAASEAVEAASETETGTDMVPQGSRVPHSRMVQC